LSIKEYKEQFESKLPPESEVIERNKKISSLYAQLYLDNPDVFKWAGMASFASNHIGIGLLPYRFSNFDLLDLQSSCRKKGLVNDFNLLRHINNRIYDDIAWTHQAYLDGGISLISDLMKDDPHYAKMLVAWEALDSAIQHKSEYDSETLNLKIWDANIKLLRHEQEFIVQPMFDQFGAIFKKLITLCASLDFSPNHLKTDRAYHSTFVMYMYKNELSLLLKSMFIPDLTRFMQRWLWLENKVSPNWILKEREDPSLTEKIETIYKQKAC